MTFLRGCGGRVFIGKMASPRPVQDNDKFDAPPSVRGGRHVGAPMRA